MKVNEILQRINEVSSRTALATSDYDFLATHMPFKKLSYSMGGDSQSNKKQLSEEEFLEEEIYPERDEHKMIFVKGNTGSGKSHLIRWFYNKYKSRVDEKEELIILISRDSNSLKGTLNQIVDSDLFKGFKEEAEFKKIIQAGESLEKEKLKEDIPALLVSSIRSTTVIDISKREKNGIANFLGADIIREKVLFRDGGPISRIITGMIGSEDGQDEKSEKNFFKEDFDIVDTNILREMRDTEGDLGASTRAISYAEDIERSDSKKEQLAGILNDLVDEVIKKIIGLGRSDLQEVFKKIRSKLKQENMKLTIFFEDITTTTGIHKELIETLIVNHKETREDLCRIMSFVGITENYYSSQIRTNISDRAAYILEIEESSLIETKEDISKFIGLYMNAINQPKDKIKSWYLDSAEKKKLPVSDLNKDKKWSLVQLNSEREVSIYPFTKDALWNIYETRDSEGREPRGFLRLIINNVYANYNTVGIDYLLDLDVYDNVKIPDLKNPLDEEKINNFSNNNVDIKRRTETLIRVWGDGSLTNRIENGRKTIGNIDEDIFKEFNLPIISGEIKEEKEEADPISELEPELIRSSKPDRKTIEYEREITQLGQWREGHRLIGHKKYRDYLLDLCKKFINWEEEGISKYLIDILLTTSVLHIEGQNVDSSDGLTFKRDSELYYVLIGLIHWEYHGDRSWEFENGHKYILRITQYLNKYKKAILDLIQKPKGENWNFEDILLLNSYYFNLLNRRLEENLSIEEMYKLLFKKGNHIISNSYKELDEKWITLANIYNDTVDTSLNQEILIKYFHLPLGTASSGITENMDVYAYKIIESIKKLSDLNWDYGSYKVKIRSSIEIYRPLNFFEKEIQKKIPKLLDSISNNLDNLLVQLEAKYEGKLDESKIKTMSNNINIYLDMITDTGFINSKTIYDEIIYETDEKLIYSTYSRLEEYGKLSDFEKLLYISRNEIEILRDYNRNLTKLEEEIEEYNKNCKANLESMSDKNKDYTRTMEKMKEIESEIILQIERYLR